MHSLIGADNEARIIFPLAHVFTGRSLLGSPFYIHDCYFSVGDDNIAQHSNDTIIEDCSFGTGHGASIGSVDVGYIQNVTFRLATLAKGCGCGCSCGCGSGCCGDCDCGCGCGCGCGSPSLISHARRTTDNLELLRSFLLLPLLLSHPLLLLKPITNTTLRLETSSSTAQRTAHVSKPTLAELDMSATLHTKTSLFTTSQPPSTSPCTTLPTQATQQSKFPMLSSGTSQRIIVPMLVRFYACPRCHVRE